MRWVIRCAVMATAMLLAAPAWAMGGWAATVFDDLPERFTPGATYELTYTIKQHAQNPVDVDATSVVLRSTDGTEHTFVATPLEGTGRYIVEVTVPADGTWQWSVTQGMFNAQQLGELPLAPAPSPASPGLMVARIVLPAAALVALVAFARQLATVRSRRQAPVVATSQ